MLGSTLARCETVAIDSRRLAELEQKAARVEALEKEVAELRSALGRSQSPAPQSGPGSPVVGAPSQPAPLTPPQAVVPELNLSNRRTAAPERPVKDSREPIFVGELLKGFETNPADAGANYLGKRMDLVGTVSWVEKSPFGSPYTLIFAFRDSRTRLECDVVPDKEFTKVYVSSDRTRIVGETETHKVTLVKLGEEVHIAGKISSFKNEVVKMNGSLIRR